jgi:hypothetical protein
LTILAAIMLVLVFLFVPETLRALVGNGSGYANPTPFQYFQHRPHQQPANTPSRFLQQPHFLAPFTYLLQIDVFVGLLFTGLLYSCYYCYMLSATSLLNDYYGLTTIQIGLCFIPSGVGCVAGSFVAGKIMDRSFRAALVRYKTVHGSEVDRAKIPLDFPIYHTRLHTTWPFFLMAQCVTLVYGWLFHVHAPLAIPIIFQFISK